MGGNNQKNLAKFSRPDQSSSLMMILLRIYLFCLSNLISENLVNKKKIF